MNAPSRILSLLALAVLTGPLAAAAAETTSQATVPPDARNATLPGMIREAEKGVFFIRVKDANGKLIAMGTGFLANKTGGVLTSLHVIRPGMGFAASADGNIWTKLADFVEGAASANAPAGTRQLRVRATAPHGFYLIIHEISVGKKSKII